MLTSVLDAEFCELRDDPILQPWGKPLSADRLAGDA